LNQALGTIEAMKAESTQIAIKAKDRQYNKEWIEFIQVRNLITLLESICRSALAREDSRGAHYRMDFPKIDNDKWLRNVVVKNVKGKMETETVPIVMTTYDPRRSGQ
jgi:succinate dehydrogenase/fumarate reductase flavoprotein subunit